MRANDFDFGDFDELGDPVFAEDEFLLPESTPVRTERNMVFLVLLTGLVMVFILGLVGTSLLVVQGIENRDATQARNATIYANNTAVQIAAQGTIIAKTYTKTPTPTSTATDTPLPTNTTVATSTLAPTLTSSTLPTWTPSLSPSPSIAVDMTSTWTVTPIPSLSTASPTAGPKVGQNPTKPIATASRTPRRVTPSLPNTGLFDDLARGRARPESLAGIGILGIGLMGVIVAARRLRIR
jgi:hypothetical protein